MNDQALTPTRILEAAEDVLRRYGPAKATVVDVARALGVSHGSVYRHFPSRRRCATRSPSAGWPASRAAGGRGRRGRPRSGAAAGWTCWSPPNGGWHGRTRSCSPPTSSWPPTPGRWSGHVDDLTGQLARIIADGVTRGELAAADPATAGRAVFDATARFHNPTHAPEWADPSIDAAYQGVRSLVLQAGRPGPPRGFLSWCSPPPPLRLQALKDRRRMLLGQRSLMA